MPLVDHSTPDLFTYAATAQAACSPTATPLPAEFRALCDVLRTHVGAESAITAWDLAQAAAINQDGTRGSRERMVRHLLSVHRASLPWPLVADSTGFYRPATADEAAHYDANLSSRIREIAIALSTTRRQLRRSGFLYLGRGRWSSASSTSSPSSVSSLSPASSSPPEPRP